MSLIIYITIAFIAGAGLAYLLYGYVLTSRKEQMLREAQAEAEALKKSRMLEAKEHFLQLKAEHENVSNERNARISQSENRIKQKEVAIAQRIEDLQRQKRDLEVARENLANQVKLVEKKQEETEALHRQQIEHLERISGLSAAEARAQMADSLKAEAKSEAMSYINEVMDEAKMTASKEAKSIVIKTIQRVATETAVENSVTVFPIESDEIKGRIIGREGRNIRALEAATGVELIVDDTPEAIILSGFDPVRREVARLSLHQLVTDGRIHPARIEEVVARIQKQVEEEVVEVGNSPGDDIPVFDDGQDFADFVVLIGFQGNNHFFDIIFLDHPFQIGNAPQQGQVLVEQPLVIVFYQNISAKFVSRGTGLRIHLVEYFHCFFVVPDDQRVEADLPLVDFTDSLRSQQQPEKIGKRKMKD